jgi:hypothetical protein
MHLAIRHTSTAAIPPRYDSAFDGPRTSPPEDVADEEEGLDLPVNPDEGAPLIPDDERVANLPF